MAALLHPQVIYEEALETSRKCGILGAEDSSPGVHWVWGENEVKSQVGGKHSQPSGCLAQSLPALTAVHIWGEASSWCCGSEDSSQEPQRPTVAVGCWELTSTTCLKPRPQHTQGLPVAHPLGLSTPKGVPKATGSQVKRIHWLVRRKMEKQTAQSSLRQTCWNRWAPL